jgi:hypothetical protein
MAPGFKRIAAASHAAAGFATVEDLIGLTVVHRFTIVLYRRRRATSTLDARTPVTVSEPSRPLSSGRRGAESPRR